MPIDVNVSTQRFDPDENTDPAIPTEEPQGTVVNEPDARTVQVEPQDRSAEEKAHNEKMIKKAEEGTGNHDPADDLFAGKYKTQEEFHKAFLEASKKKYGNLEDAYKALAGDLSKPEGDPEPDPEPVADPEPDAQPDNDDDSGNDEQPVIGKADMDEFVQEFVNDGGLSDDSYKKLDAAGFDRGMVDTYMQGIEAQRDQLFSIAGGKNEFFQMTEWAAEDGGLSKQDIDLFNDDLNSGNMTKMKRAVSMLKSAYESSGGVLAPQKKVEGSQNGDSVTGYTDVSDLKLDMANPLYATSASFRNMVREKLRRGTI